MQALVDIAVGFIALQHAGFLVLEMFLWDKPLGMRVFRHQPDFARATRALAANQGLYNGFLAAGLAWGLWSGARDVKLFFLACVIVAGAYGAWSVSRRIFWIQGAPALAALALLVVAGK